MVQPTRFVSVVVSAAIVLSGASIRAQSTDRASSTTLATVDSHSSTGGSSEFGLAGAGPIERSIEREALRLAGAASVAHDGQRGGSVRTSGNWIRDHPIETCALIGATVGILAGLQASRDCSSGRCYAQTLVGLPVYGAAIGAFTGIMIVLSR